MAAFVVVRWQYGLKQEERFGLVYNDEKGRGETITEPAGCIERVVGFLDIQSRRYYIARMRSVDDSEARAVLQGLI